MSTAVKKKRPVPSRNRKAVTSLSKNQRERIFFLVAALQPVRQVASEFSIKYASVRHVVFAEWKALYPEHFAEHTKDGPPTIYNLQHSIPANIEIVNGEPKVTKKRRVK